MNMNNHMTSLHLFDEDMNNIDDRGGPLAARARASTITKDEGLLLDFLHTSSLHPHDMMSYSDETTFNNARGAGESGIPRICGFMSALFSALTIYVIFRSSTGLSSIFHRLIFGICIVDFLRSVAIMSLVTDEEASKLDYYEQENRSGIYCPCPFDEETLFVAKEFFSSFGTHTLHFYSTALCVYFTWKTAAFSTMPETEIKKRGIAGGEPGPVLYLLPIIGAALGMIAILTPLLVTEACTSNPTLPTSAWYNTPHHDADHMNHGRGQQKGQVYFCRIEFLFANALVISICLVASMLMKLFKRESLLLEKYVAQFADIVGTDPAEDQSNKKIVIMFNAFLAYMITFATKCFIDILIVSGHPTRIIGTTYNVTDREVHFIIEMLQSLVIFQIFLLGKITNLHLIHPEAKVYDVLTMIFWQKEEYKEDSNDADDTRRSAAEDALIQSEERRRRASCVSPSESRGDEVRSKNDVSMMCNNSEWHCTQLDCLCSRSVGMSSTYPTSDDTRTRRDNTAQVGIYYRETVDIGSRRRYNLVRRGSLYKSSELYDDDDSWGSTRGVTGEIQHLNHTENNNREYHSSHD